MDRNPYTPPAATVADPVPAPVIDRPYAVKRGVLLLWISLAVGLLDTGWGLYTDGQDERVGDVIALVLVLPILGFYVLLIFKIWARRHWARVTYLILTIIGYSLTIYDGGAWFGNPNPDVIETVLGAAGKVTEIVGVVLIFTRRANRWFRPRAA